MDIVVKRVKVLKASVAHRYQNVPSVPLPSFLGKVTVLPSSVGRGPAY